MIGRKNIAFGFIYLVFTASLGLVMVDMYDDYGKAAQEKQGSVQINLKLLLQLVM